jgi:hypothetical protein
MLDYDEKRDFIRMQAECQMSYRLAGEENYTEGSCLNISGSGILFKGPLALEAGRAAEIHLVPDNRITPPLTAYIEVVRCVLGDDGQHEIAGAIKGIKGE